MGHRASLARTDDHEERPSLPVSACCLAVSPSLSPARSLSLSLAPSLHLGCTLTLAAKRYLRGWGTFDFLISVPWSVIEPLSPVIRWLKVMKLLRYARVFRLSGRDNGKAPHLKRVLSVLMYFMIGAHWVASVWWFSETAR